MMSQEQDKIKSIKAREILDSRGNPALEVEVAISGGIFYAGVPSGVSTGKLEAVELRDGSKRYHGKGVLRAVKNINEVIGPQLKGKDVTRQKDIDDLLCNLDGTENKSKLGANAIVGVSMAVCRAGAAAKKISFWHYISQIYQSLTSIDRSGPKLPKGAFNIINGGAHAGNNLDVQEFMIVPQAEKFSDNLQIAAEIYHELKNLLRSTYGPSAINVGDEGGFAPPMKTAQEALDAILRAAKNLGYDNKIKFILDVAASQFYSQRGVVKLSSTTPQGKYKMKLGVFTEEGLLNFYEDLLGHYPIIGLEDPFDQEDWEGWEMLANRKSQIVNRNLLLIGDDLLVTNPKRIKEAKEKNSCNAMILKVNQIGTLSEALEAARLAKSYGWKIIVSHRSGETCDDFIADLAVGIGADYIKAGAPSRGERVAKYNRLLQIEEEIK